MNAEARIWLAFPRTHSIDTLRRLLLEANMGLDLDAEDAELLDTIYVPSKYPLGNALPLFEPDFSICSKCLQIAESVRRSIGEHF